MRKKSIRRSSKARNPSQKPRLPTKKVELSEEELAGGFAGFMKKMAENRKKLLIEYWTTHAKNPVDMSILECVLNAYDFTECRELMSSVPILERINEHQRAKEKQT